MHAGADGDLPLGFALSADVGVDVYLSNAVSSRTAVAFLALVDVDVLLAAAWATASVFFVDANVLLVPTVFLGRKRGGVGRVAGFATFPSADLDFSFNLGLLGDGTLLLVSVGGGKNTARFGGQRRVVNERELRERT